MKRLALVALLALAGCRSAVAASPSLVEVRVLDESGRPVASAELATPLAVAARTDDTGHAVVSVDGAEGEAFSLEVRCPSAYRSPSEVITVRKFQSNEVPEFVVRCQRRRHTLTIAVHADGAPDVPVLHLGKAVARTDLAGDATVQVEGDVDDRIDLVLDTSAPRFAKTHPQNPSASFDIGQHDETRDFRVRLVTDPPPKRKRYKKPTATET